MNFLDIYQEVVSFRDIGLGNKKIECHSMNITKQNRCCIFCGQTTEHTQFTKVAHAISETLGNKALISHFECDVCNKNFGDSLEDSFGKFIYPYKFISGVFGKKNKLTIKDQSIDSSISFGSYRLERGKSPVAVDCNEKPENYIIEASGNGIFEELNGGFRLNIPRQRYNPKLVYAALLKMAYGLLPLRELNNYKNGISSLALFVAKKSPLDELTERNKYLESLPREGILISLPGANPLSGISTYLYRAQSNYLDRYPSLIFRVDFNNFSISIPVFSDNQSAGDYKLIPPPIGQIYSLQRMDFSIEEKTYSYEFSGAKLEISKEEYVKIEKILRDNQLLKHPQNLEK